LATNVFGIDAFFVSIVPLLLAVVAVVAGQEEEQ
jgi:hypothetical protein